MGHFVFSLVIDIPHTLFMSPSFSIPSEHSVAVRLLYCQFFLCVSCVYSHFPEKGLREETETLEIKFHYAGRNNNSYSLFTLSWPHYSC